MKLRALNEEMFAAFSQEDGRFHKILTQVKKDKTLDLEFRGDKADVYYRGGCICHLSSAGLEFNVDYAAYYQEKKDVLQAHPDVSHWLTYLPFYKQALDYDIDANHKYEREFQQLVVRDNNYVKEIVAKSSDYYITDIEFADIGEGMKPEFDFTAIKWKTKERNNPQAPKVTLIEMKYGDEAISSEGGKPGIKKHLQDMQKFIQSDSKELFCKDVETIFNQKCQLGLCVIATEQEQLSRKPISIHNQDIEVMFLLSNHQPTSKILFNELNSIDFASYEFPIQFAFASCMGYCLYDAMMLSPEGMMSYLRK